MAIDLSLDRAARLARITPWVDLDVGVLVEVRRLLDAAGSEPTFGLLFDLRNVDNAPSVITGVALGSWWVDNRSRFAGRLGVVAPPRLLTRDGIPTMEATARSAGMEIRVFDSESACRRWLTGRPGPAVPAAT